MISILSTILSQNRVGFSNGNDDYYADMPAVDTNQRSKSIKYSGALCSYVVLTLSNDTE
jgi:hypothetical protein